MSRVLRLARSDEQNEFILLHVVKLGPAPLDLILTATEGESPYTARGEVPMKKIPITTTVPNAA